jgi:hypothetical protein
MTTVNYLTKTELPSAFNTGNFDLASQQAVINQLIHDGLYTNSTPDDGKSVWVESDIYQGVQQPPLFDSRGDDSRDHDSGDHDSGGDDSRGNSNVPGFVQVLEVEGSNVQVNTDSTLKIIVDDGSHPQNFLEVTGGNQSVYVALGNSNTTVDLDDQGNDTVLAGSGNDSILANSGNDVLIGGSGADTLHGSTGADSLYGGSGHNDLIAGTGHHQLLAAGSGATTITDTESGGYDTLVAGSGNDTITGLQGDHFLLPTGTMVASGNDVYNIYDGHGNSTINLGTGADSVNFHTTAGNDTITNGGQHTDTINFTGTSGEDGLSIKSITPGTGAQAGDYLVKLTNGQSVNLVGHGVDDEKNAFTLVFHDGTVNLKGGT